jgi:hypothetical protein
MRAAISLFVSSLLLGSLALNNVGAFNRLSYLLNANSSSEQLLAAKPKTRSNQPDRPAPHRGSGRRELMEYSRNNRAAV